MATRLKTIEYAFPTLTTLVDNTLTALTTITAYIPEFSGTVTFKKVIFTITFKEGATTTTGNYTTRRIDVNVGGAGAVSYTNSNSYSGSGENTSVSYSADATANFVTNWASGTSKTIAASVLLDATGATLALRDVDVTFYITYEYDDTQTTQIKTVYIPLDAPVGTLATSKPGAATATIPALDTELPESTKTYRNMFVVCQNNVNATAAATDSTLSMQIDSLTAFTSSSLEMGAVSDYWTRFVWDITSLGMTTNATHSFYLWASVARHNHSQAYLVVTYEFDASASTDVFVSVKIPVGKSGPMGGTTSSDYQRLIHDLWIEENNIVQKQCAFYAFWDSAAVIAGLNFRLGTGGFVTYTDGATVMCGSSCAMIRNDSAFTLARGKNRLNVDAYRTDATDTGKGFTGFFIINYTGDKPAEGYGAANHTVIWNIEVLNQGPNLQRVLSAQAISLPETQYFVNNFGMECLTIVNSTGTPTGTTVQVERLSGEGGIAWEDIASHMITTDAETGTRFIYSDNTRLFTRWLDGSLTDPDTNRLPLQTSRRWNLVTGNDVAAFYHIDLYLTYHAITYDVSGTVSNSGGGTVTLNLCDAVSHEKFFSTTRSGNGAYSFVWFDNTVEVFVDAYEDSTHVGRSNKSVAQ